MSRALAVLCALLVSSAAWSAPFALKSLSNRADLISGGDALVEVVLPAGTNPANVRVMVGGRDVSSSFAVRFDGRYVGLVTGLADGPNDLYARVVGTGSSARLTIVSHPVGGPIFAGAQLQPWICAHNVATPLTVTVPGTTLSATVNSLVSGLDGNPTDDKCDAAPKYSFFYQPVAKQGTTCTFTTTGSTACFVAYDMNNPPAAADIADFTNDRGDTVKSIIVVERGTMNRGIYQLVTFYDPTRPNTPWNPQRGWNGKLLWKFGASAAVSRFQTPPGTSVFDDAALRRGFMVASSSLTDHGTNSNDTLAAETMMMVKERIAEEYGEVRYTIGNGCSGGSIMQQSIAGAYPGLLQGIQPNCSFSDTLTTFIEIADCGVLQQKYYTTPDGSLLTNDQRAAINGHVNTGFCQAWILSFLPAADPTRRQNCGGNAFPAALTYDPAARPLGVRCTGTDHDASMLGVTQSTNAAGNTYFPANSPIDNIGIQYGLSALASGVITPEQFVRLNEGAGSYTPDLGWTGPSPAPGQPAPRLGASDFTLKTVYSGGLVSDGRQLAKVAIIDLRGNQAPGGDIHMNWRAWETRDRLDRQFGDHDNQLIWAYTGGGGAGGVGNALAVASLTTMDQWLANVEADTSNLPLERKIRIDKPAGAGDLCLTTNGATDLTNVVLGSANCPVAFQASPRQAAGGPRAENIFKCSLKPLDFTSAEYTGVVFTDDQKARLAKAFPAGVCDWTRLGVQQVPEDGWTTYQDGPGGKPLGDAPVALLDSTAPAIAATFSPTPNAAGWNNTPVTVRWSVADPEMGIGSTSGCDATTLSSETGGASLTCSATNKAGVPASSSVVAKVDLTPPSIAGLPAGGCTIWPPNHKLVQIASVAASDALSQVAPGSLSIAVSCNGGACAADDVVVSGGAVQVRAERAGNEPSRVYSIQASARDVAGNVTTRSATCTVPHDQGR
jgi:Tannase-like family of unknown function (DUF6351)